MPLIEEMYAFISYDKDDNDEGLTALHGGYGVWMPMVGADMARQIAAMTGKNIKICKFSTREVLEIIEA
jgi:dihydroorotase-like cyclic amidohydrolase